MYFAVVFFDDVAKTKEFQVCSDLMLCVHVSKSSFCCVTVKF